jgi:Lon protease-like protein
MPQGYVKATDLPQVIPVFPLDGALLLPRGQLPLNIFEPRYLNMVDDAIAGDRVIGMVQTNGGQKARPSIAPIGCAGRITSFAETSDGRYLITLTGAARFKVVSELPAQSAYRQVQVDFSPFEDDLKAAPEDPGFDREQFLDALKAYLTCHSLDVDWDTAQAAPEEALINSLAMALPFDSSEKQALLEAADLTARRATLTTLLEIDAAEDAETPHSMQ